MELAKENVIVTASNFNVTLVTQVWLLDNGIILRDEFAGPMLFTPAMVQVEASLFNFLVIPPQVQFEPKTSENLKQQTITDRLGKFLSLLPHTPYNAVGLNFNWFYRPQDPQTISSIGRKLFFNQGAPFAKHFDRTDAKFGAYYSKDELGFRLKLHIGPVEIQSPEGSTEEVLHCAFNYHRQAKSVADLTESLNRWNDAKQQSRGLAEDIEKAI